MSPRHWCPPAALLMLSAAVAQAAETSPPAASAPHHKPAPSVAPPPDSTYATHLPAGRFGTVTVYIPEGKPNSAAIFLSGDGGWELGVINMAHALVQTGAVVIGVDIRQYFASLGRAKY